MKVSIVIPAYNEEKRIRNTLSKYAQYFESKAKKGEEYEILVVINNTTDRTEEIVKSVKKNHKIVRYINLVKGGKGYAVLEGFKDALKRDNDLVGFVDADLATSPEAFHALIGNMKGYDAVIASRYIKGAVVNPKPMLRRILVSRIFNAAIRALFLMPYRDTQCGAKLFKRNVAEHIVPLIGMTRWAFDVELVYTTRREGFKLGEIPTTWSDQAYSTINFMKAGPWMFLAIVRLRILNSPLRRFIRVYDMGVRLLR